MSDRNNDSFCYSWFKFVVIRIKFLEIFLVELAIHKSILFTKLVISISMSLLLNIISQFKLLIIKFNLSKSITDKTLLVLLQLLCCERLSFTLIVKIILK